MSNTVQQDENAAQPGHTVIASTLPVPQSEGGPKSTPEKKKLGADLPFETEVKRLEEVRNQLGREMDGRWMGAMPVEDFLKAFLPPASEPLPDLPEDPFGEVPRGVERARYRPFVSARLFHEREY